MSALWNTFGAVVRKELLQVSRDTTLVRLLVTFQLFDIGSIAWLDTTVKDMPMVIVDQSHTAESRELVDRLAATKTFAVRYLTSSTEQARSHIRAGQAKIAVIIPPTYSRDRLSASNANILALVDGSDAASSGEAISALEGVTAEMDVATAKEVVAAENADDGAGTARVETAPLYLFNPDAKVALFMLPGMLALLLSDAYTSRVSSIADERDDGNLERLLMTPLSTMGLMLGKAVPYFIVAVLNAIVYLAVMRWVIDVPIRGSIVWLLVANVLFVMTILGTGLYISVAAESKIDAVVVLAQIKTPQEMLSGYYFPLSSVPRWLLPVSYLLPETHFIEIMRGMCLRGASVTDLAPHFLVLGAMPVVIIWAAKRRFDRTLMLD